MEESLTEKAISEFNYLELGLKVGLEIHQQLDTKKLFCNCPSIIREETPDKTVKRFLRSVSGETGKTDIAAKYESEKNKRFIYEYYTDTTCLVELDEEPPHLINNDALNIVLQVSKIMNCELVDEVHVMRKTVIDGSNTSGFQRTALISRNGSINVNNSIIGVETVCLEEDAARIILRSDTEDIYRLDRLGIPLIEIATSPDIKTPIQAKECAGYIGMILRSTGRVKRGLGTIRQDVNVSITGGSRVEIKGVQDLKILDKVVSLEVLRQLNMLRVVKELNNRKITESSIKSFNMLNGFEFFTNTNSKIFKKGLETGIYYKVYKNFKGLLGFGLNPNRRFGSELSDRIKSLGLNGLIHTDEDLQKYSIIKEVEEIYSKEKLLPNDSLIIIIGTQQKCAQAFNRIDQEIISLIKNGLGKEVRNAKEDGTSAYLRPMPGSSRMYPETDTKTIIPSYDNISMPELLTEKISRIEKEYSLPNQVAKDLVFTDFELYTKKYPQIKSILIAEILVSMPKEIKTRFNIEINSETEIFRDQLTQIFEKLNTGQLTKEAVFEILLEIGQNKQLQKLDFSKYQTNEDEVVKFITETITKNPSLNSNAVMGIVMKEYRGKYSGQKIQELIKKIKE